MKKMISVAICVLVLISVIVSASADSVADRFRYVPTDIKVNEDKVTVRGYFVNLNTEEVISNLTDYEMAVYLDDELLVEGYFGELNPFSVLPLGTKACTFTFNGQHDLNEGTYSCDDSFNTLVSCGFTYSS